MCFRFRVLRRSARTHPGSVAVHAGTRGEGTLAKGDGQGHVQGDSKLILLKKKLSNFLLNDQACCRFIGDILLKICFLN